jgi:membrane-associated phospholipid phosphatase
MTVLSALLCELNPKLEKKSRYFVYGSILWTLIVSAARLSDGHHFVSDVAFGAFFGSLFAMLVAYLVYLPTPEENETEILNDKTPVNPVLSLRGKRFVSQRNRSHGPAHKPCKRVL